MNISLLIMADSQISLYPKSAISIEFYCAYAAFEHIMYITLIQLLVRISERSGGGGLHYLKSFTRNEIKNLMRSSEKTCKH